MKEHTFSFGDSNKGPIGGVIRVLATNKHSALKLAQEGLADVDGITLDECTTDHEITDVRVYFNSANISLDDLVCIDECEPEDC